MDAAVLVSSPGRAMAATAGTRNRKNTKKHDSTDNTHPASTVNPVAASSTGQAQAMNPSSNKKRKRKTKKKSNAGTQEQVSKHKGPSVEEVAEQAMRKKQKQLLELEKRQRRKASKGEKGGTQESKRSTAESEEHLAQNAVGEDEEEDAVVEDEIVDVNAEEDEEVVEGDELAVEGVVCNGKLFLVDKRRSIVYASERDAEEQLVRVGAWDPLKREPVPDVTEAGLAPALYPFTVDPADHCESPVESFEHIAGLLGEVSKLVKKPRVDLKIYDPFFCAGSVIAHLATCGFPTVYNRCEDFYEVQREGKGPDFDVIVTNPPYSGEHVEKIVEFCQASGKPWFLLLPNYFVNKPWYTALEAASRFYVVPRKRYLYRAPKGARLKGDVRKDRKTSPFTTFWFCDTGASLTKHRKRIVKKMHPDCRVALRIDQIPAEVLDKDRRRARHG